VPYLSDIQHRRVIEPNGNEVAKLVDLAVVPQGQFPAVQWAILATPEGERVVRWSEMAQEIGHLRLRGRLSTIADAPLPQEALRLARDLMDKQVVDTHGAKVVRVNDLQLSEVEGQLRLVGAEGDWLARTRAVLADPAQRYILTVFAYGCNLGPTEAARHMGTRRG